MNKKQIKQIAKRLFIAGKNNVSDFHFDEEFERVYSEVYKEKK